MTFFAKVNTGWGIGAWFNSNHGLFSRLTPIMNTNTVSLKHLMNILPTFHWKAQLDMF